jgi:hypothetical protein
MMPTKHKPEADREPPLPVMFAVLALWAFLAPLLWLLSLSWRK